MEFIFWFFRPFEVHGFEIRNYGILYTALHYQINVFGFRLLHHLEHFQFYDIDEKKKMVECANEQPNLEQQQHECMRMKAVQFASQK